MKKSVNSAAIFPVVLKLLMAISVCVVSELHASTVLVGHRGGDTKLSPENTLACLDKRYSAMVWGHEIDVRTTADGDAILMHDASVNRTTNGTGLVANLSTSYIRALDAGSWKGASFNGEQVPFLREALAAIKINGTRAYLDMKSATPESVRLAVTHSSFTENKLTFLIFSDPQATAFIGEFPAADIYRSMWNVPYTGATTDASLSRMAGIGVKGVTIWIGHYTPEYVNAIHAVGMKAALVGKTIDSAATMETYINGGIDELWLDDLKLNVSDYNTGEGVLKIPQLDLAPELDLNTTDKSVTIKWRSDPGVSYQIECSSNLREWDNLSSLLPAGDGGGRREYTDSIADDSESKKFYRVKSLID